MEKDKPLLYIADLGKRLAEAGPNPTTLIGARATEGSFKGMELLVGASDSFVDRPAQEGHTIVSGVPMAEDYATTDLRMRTLQAGGITTYAKLPTPEDLAQGRDKELSGFAADRFKYEYPKVDFFTFSSMPGLAGMTSVRAANRIFLQDLEGHNFMQRSVRDIVEQVRGHYDFSWLPSFD